MKEWFTIMGCVILFSLGLYGFLSHLDHLDKAQGTEICRQYGGDHIRTHGHLLCVNPKTRQVYLPE